YRAKANAESPGASFNLTRAQVDLCRRGVDLRFDPGSPNGCSYPDGIVNPNSEYNGTTLHPTVTGWILMTTSDEVNIGTSWQAFTTDDPTQWKNPPLEEAYDFQVRIHGFAFSTSSGTYVQIHPDNVRDEGRSF